MAFREKVKRAFNRSNSGSKGRATVNKNGVKIEYYKKHEIPKSKFRGPFDPEHQRKLAEWSFEAASVDRRRSLDLSLSPCTTLPDYLNLLNPNTSDDVAPEGPQVSDSSITISHDEFASNRGTGSASDSSTAVDPESTGGSMMTLLPDNGEDLITNLKETVRYTSPVIKSPSPLPLSKGINMPFSPDDLTRALNAIQIC